MEHHGLTFVQYIRTFLQLQRNKQQSVNLTIFELARAVKKSETYVRQHIHRKHLSARKEGRNVFVALDEAARWARARGLSFAPPARISARPGTLEGRTARMTVLTLNGAGAQQRNLFTLIRHRRRDALGPWASEPDGPWYGEDPGFGMRAYHRDASLERCQAWVDRILESGALSLDGVEVRYDVEPAPRRHRAFRDYRQLSGSPLLSPFSRHSAEIIEYWSLAEEPRRRWLKVLKSLDGKAPLRFGWLNSLLTRGADRIGNLMIAGADDAISCDLLKQNDRALRLQVDATELMPGAYRATVWASHSDDEVLRREIPVTSHATEIEVATDVDHLGFAMYRAADGECVDLMEAYVLKESGFRMQVSGPPLQVRNRRGRSIHRVNVASSLSTTSVVSFDDSTSIDKEIRRLWLDRRVHAREAAAYRDDSLERFQPDQLELAVQYFVNLLRQDTDRTSPIYLGDPYFMVPMKGEVGTKLYLDLFTLTAGRPLLVLCAKTEDDGAQPWWIDFPDSITGHIRVRSFLTQQTRDRGFHDRFLSTSQREILISNSFNGWDKHGVTFVRLPYAVYRSEAERFWDIDIESETEPQFVREFA